MNQQQTGHDGHRVFEAVVVFTGGAILALEVLASRIMTPYFGVSLLIWTSILSTTLVGSVRGNLLELATRFS